MHKILYVHQDGKFTGSAVSLSYILLYLDRSKYEPWVLMAEEGPARNLFEAAGSNVVTLQFSRFWTAPGPRWTERAAIRQLLFFFPNPAIKSWVGTLSPSIIHINDKAAAPVGLILKSLKIPIVQHLRSTYFSTASPLNKWVSIRMIKQLTTALVAISADEADGFDPSSCQVVYNSIDLDQAAQAKNRRMDIRKKHGIREDEFLVGYLSIVSTIRGVENYLEMARHILASEGSQIRYRFMVVGKLPKEGKQKIALHKKEKELGLSGHILYTDFQQDALGYLATFDVLVVCNNQGVLGRPPLEALAIGTPTVAFSGHSGESQVLKNGETAIVVPKGNISSLASGVIQLAQKPALHAKMRQKGIAYAQEIFSPKKNAQKIMDLYQSLINGVG